MKCEIVATKEIKHFANNDSTAHTLIKAGVLRLIETEPGEMVRMGNGAVIPKMEPAPEPKWTVAMVVAHGSDTPIKIPAIVFQIGSTIYERFCGEPAQVKKAWSRRVVPDDILKQYAKTFKDFYDK